MQRGIQTILLVIALLLVVTAVRVPLLSIPLERDEGEYAYIAWRLRHNELPYRDWVDQKPPAVFYIYRLALSLLVEPVRAIHLVGLLFAAVSTCALFCLGLRFMAPFWAWLGAALFALLGADPLVQGTAANTEIFMLCPLIFSQIASFTAAAKNQRNVWLMVLVGALNGIAFLFKQVAIVNWFFLAALYPICASREKRWRDTVSFFAWSAMGLLIVIGLVVLYFWRRGGLDEFVDNVSLTTWSTSEALVYRRGLNIAGARLRRSHERRASCGRLPLQDWSLFSHPIEPSGHSLWQVGLSRV